MRISGESLYIAMAGHAHPRRHTEDDLAVCRAAAERAAHEVFEAVRTCEARMQARRQNPHHRCLAAPAAGQARRTFRQGAPWQGRRCSCQGWFPSRGAGGVGAELTPRNSAHPSPQARRPTSAISARVSSAWASIWRIRSRVRWNASPISSSVWGPCVPPRPKRSASTRCSRSLRR